jgi:hypothetical protein
MKIFGFNFGEKIFAPLVTPDTQVSLRKQDASPTIRPELKSISIPENKKPANIPPVASKVLAYNQVGARRGQFNESEYDLALINRIEDTDSYVHQAFVKKVGLMFKEGYDLVGADPKTIQYIKLRFAQIARATNTPTDELLRSLGRSLIKKSNAFLVKARKESASGGRSRIVPGTSKELEPVAGYFIAPAETMQYEADKNGRVTRWKQQLPDGQFTYFRPEDVIHFYFNRKDGFIYGTPTIVPVIDDIRSLRKIEENIELLVYQHLFPLFHYKIGTDDFPATVDEQGNDEIDLAKREIQVMPAEGGLVTSHRHEISLIGAENRSLRAEGYLEHFKKRVFSGLGISAVDMGEGECYSADTETLTENGWKFHWQIDHTTERIATYNPATNKIEFNFANYKHESHYRGPMFHFTNGEELNVLVTPKHDMWLQNVVRVSVWGKVHAEDLLTKPNLHCNMLLSTAFDEEEVSQVFPDELIESWATLAGWIVGIGEYVPATNQIMLKTNKIPRGEHPLARVFSELHIPFNVTKVTSHARRHLEITFDADEYSGQLKKYLKSEGHSVVNEVLKLPIAARKIVADEMLASGGTSKGFKYIKKYGKARHWWFVSSSHTVLDIVQTILLSCGYLAVKKKGQHKDKSFEYVNVRCALRRQQLSPINQETIKQVSYDGTIYCYNVPNHLFLTRRQGCVAINGNTANRATSDNMSRNLVDSVKDIQRVMESQFSAFIINELLLESTFGSDVLNDESRVSLKFKEIDLDYQIKKENHYADQFTKNTISHHEARIGMGRQPMRMPTAEEIDGNPNIAENYPEWYGTFWKLIDEPKALIQAIDEPYSAAAITAAANKGTEVTSANITEAGEQQKEHEVALEAEKGKAKVAIAKLRPKPAAKKKDSFLNVKFEALESDTIRMINQGSFSNDWLKHLAFMSETDMIRDLRTKAMTAFASGYRSINPRSDQQINATMRARSKIENRVNFYVQRLIRQTLDAIKRQNIDTLEKDVRIQKVKAAFEAFRFRNDFIEDVEVRKAYNLGVIEAARSLGHTQWTLAVPHDSCSGCKLASQTIHQIGDSLDLEDVPPLHANSRSQIKIL